MMQDLYRSAAVAALAATAMAASAGPAPGTYDTVDISSAAALRATLHEVIDDHVRYDYTDDDTDVWDIVTLADIDPNDPTKVLDIYRNESYPRIAGDQPYYDREHAWPKSYGFPKLLKSNSAYTDCHHLFVANSGYNSSRNTRLYDFGSPLADEKPTVLNDGAGGGSGIYPGNSNWRTTSTWETWIGRRGDVARALMYMDLRYEGGVHGVTGNKEPDLILTDDPTLPVSDSQQNKTVGYMARLSTLLEWHRQDPVDDRERMRNDVVASFQGNRNPFIDYPEWADCVFLGECGLPWINEFHYDNDGGDQGEFVEIAGLAGTDLTGWTVVGYNGADGDPYDTVALGGVIPSTDGCYGQIAVSFPGMQNGPDGLALVDGDGMLVQFISYEGSFLAESGPAAGAISIDVGVQETGSTPIGSSIQLAGSSAGFGQFVWDAPAPETPGATNTLQTIEGACDAADPPAADAWINELHYDNDGGDQGEFVEVAGPVGLDLAGWTLVGYNGADGEVYFTEPLAGVIPDLAGGFGVVFLPISGIQNGPDGLALVRPDSSVAEFLSYEGTFVAQDGPAAGTQSVELPVAESSSTPIGASLQRTGAGAEGSDFTWIGPTTDSPGSVNAGQSFN